MLDVEEILSRPELETVLRRPRVTQIGSVNLEGRFALVKKAVLAPELQEHEEQRLVKISGGFGCKPNSLGTKCFVTFLADGEATYLRRHAFECVFD